MMSVHDCNDLPSTLLPKLRVLVVQVPIWTRVLRVELHDRGKQRSCRTPPWLVTHGERRLEPPTVLERS
jgi:hypothetical protein